MTMSDTYFSVIEALKSAGWQTPYKVTIQMVDSELIEKEGTDKLKDFDGICVPGGFGNRGIEGIISAIKFARENNKPFLGLCLGMQLATIEYARNVLGIKDASSAEFSKTKNPVIDFMPEQIKNIQSSHYGGSMRLGNFPCQVTKGTKTHDLYGQDKILERHRHRYEFNNDYRERFEDSPDFVVSGINKDLNLVEIIELKNHPFFVASQFHPEFKSRPNQPHPLFDGFINSAITNQKGKVVPVRALTEPLFK
jgi:CTP synthase